MNAILGRLEIALSYAERGWPVFPLYAPTPDLKCDCGRAVCGKTAAKHPRTSQGLKDATKDPRVIREWWTKWPSANVGIRTGAASGFFVLDEDGDEGRATMVLQGDIPTTPVAKTGNGFHYLFKLPSFPVKTGVKVLPGIDIRGEGGYIVGAGSQHISGKFYVWENGLSPEDVPLAEPLGWLLDAIAPEKKSMALSPNGKHVSTVVKGSILDGQRNNTLASLAGTMRRPGMGLEAIEAALLAENHLRCRPPLPEAEVSAIARSVVRYDPAEAELASPEVAEDRLALEFTARHGNDWRYVAAWGKWLHWDGIRWAEENTLRVFDLSRAVCRDVVARYAVKEKRFAVKVASAATVAAVERLARSDRRHAATVEEWDADPWLLNTPGGVVDLKNGELRPHRREDRLTKLARGTPGRECPTWRRFLRDVTNGDAELESYLQRIAGYALTGNTTEHALFFLYGTGANGKSVFLNTLADILGDYGATASAETFLESRNERHPTDLAALRGARLVCAIEVDQGRRWAEAKLKRLTGGDRIAARFMRGDFFEFAPQFKLFVAANRKPGLTGLDEAMRRRLHLVPFTVTIAPEKRDTALPERLRTERDGILDWTVQGCLEWQRIGLRPPERVKDATCDYFEAEDTLGRWIEDACILDPNAMALTRELFGSWRAWCKDKEAFPQSEKWLAEQLESRNYPRWKDPETRRRGFRGITLA